MSDLTKKTEELKLNDEPQHDKGDIAELVRTMLSRIGEDPAREGLRSPVNAFSAALLINDA